MSASHRKISFLSDSVLNAVIQDADICELLKILRNKRGKVNINQQNHVGLTALHQAVLSNNLDAVKLLLTHGSDVNAQDVYGFSPLHTASACGFIQISSLLVIYGADVFLLNKHVEYPIDVAKDLNIVRLLSEEMYGRLHKELYIHSLFIRKISQLWTAIQGWIKYAYMTCRDVYSKLVYKNHKQIIGGRNSVGCELIKDNTSALKSKENKTNSCNSIIKNTNRSDSNKNSIDNLTKPTEGKQNKDKCD
jgi:ankyrin repeat protein